MKKIYLTLAAGCLVAGAHADTLAFDSITSGTTFSATGSTPHFLMGEGVTLAGLGSTPTITSMNFDLVFGAAETFTDLHEVVSFWTYNGLTSGSSAAFVTNLYTVDIDFGAYTSTANTFVNSGTITLPTALQLSSATVGVEFYAEGNTGSGLVADPNNSILINTAALPGIGSIATSTGYGYYRNASNGSATAAYGLLGSDWRTLTGNTVDSLMFQLSGTAAPEPASMAFLGLGIVGLMARRRNRK